MKTRLLRNLGLLILFMLTAQIAVNAQSTCTAGWTWVQSSNNTVTFTSTSTGYTSLTNWYWFFGDSQNGTGQNPTHTYAAPGTYYACLHLIDTAGCNSYFCDSVTVTSCGVTVGAYQYQQASCSSCADGIAHSYATGGTGPYTYQWTPTGQTASSATGLLPGNYYVCATDVNGCSACTSVTITDTVACNVTIQGYCYPYATCPSCADGGAHSYASGGTAPYTYAWSPGGQTTSNITGVTPGTYTVCATDAHGCSACTTVTVVDSVICNVTVGAYQYLHASCSSCSDGIAHSYATGGTAPYTYQWTPTGQTTSSATGLSPGNYYVCATDAHGCTACTSVTITDSVICNVTVGAYQYHHASCASCADGVAHSYASGGTAPYTYNWIPTGGNQSYATGLLPGNYYVCATDANGCSACTSVTITDTVSCAVTIGAYQYNAASCSSCANGVAHSYATGGTGPYSYAWTPSGQTTPAASGLLPGTYTVCASDANGCTACTTVIIGDSSAMAGCQAYFYLYPDSSILHTYWAINYTMGTQPITYSWSWGDSTFSTGPYPQHTYADSGLYTICLTITDGTGCTSTFCRSASLLRTTNTMAYINVIAPTGISVPQVENTCRVFPNPASTRVTFEL